MDKIRTSYKKYQTEILGTKPRFVSSDKSAKLSAMADSQLQLMRSNQDFTNYDEAVFYKQKFSKLSDIATQFQKKKISQEIYHKSVKQVVQNDFMGGGAIRSTSHQQVNPRMGSKEVINVRSKSKSPLKQFFDEQEIKNSKKVNFSNLLSKEQTPLKYGLRSVSRSKNISQIRPKNDEQLKALEIQNRRLRDQLNNEKNNNLNANDDERLRQLRSKVRELDEENQKLRSEVSKSSRSDFYVEEQYEPYTLKVRQNNIVKIHNKNLYNNERMSQFGGGVSEDFNRQKKYSQIYFDNQSDYIRSDAPQRISPTKKSKAHFQEDLLNQSQSSIQTQMLNLENQQLYEENQNQICRQKIAFFKKSMVLTKTPQFDIAFKRSDFNSQMDKLRLILYVNNKDVRRFNCAIEYDFDHEDFDVLVKKKLSVVQGRSQGRQEIEIYLKNASDLGSLITAKILVGDKMRKIVVPALFIDFDNDYKYQFENIGYVERNLAQPLTIRPMSQFTTIDRASNVLELSREYEQKYEVAKMYGKSKACKGMVKLTWKRGNKLKIETCEEWRTLMGYLFLNAEETINY